VPGDEDRVDGDEPKLAPERAGMEQRGLAQPQHRDVDHRLHFREARVLEVRDGHRRVALLLGFDRVADQVARDAEFGDRVRGGGGWGRGVKAGLELRLEDALQVRLDLGDVGRHVHLVGRSLEPDLEFFSHG
jgi:hypothetical protein